MHVIFIPYGIKSAVEHLFMDMQAQKFLLPLTDKDTGEKKAIWVQGSLRLLPFGICEYVFPEEVKDAVLTTLNFHEQQYPQYDGVKFKIAKSFLRKLLRIEKIPEFKTDNTYLWIKEHVSIIPLGVRYDSKDFYDSLSNTIHEAI